LHLASAQRLSASLILSQYLPDFRVGNIMCSTPFGITDPFASADRACASADERAQRLSASLILSQRALDDIPISPAVLNAFRHH
jgi:hypothetical protein